MRYIDGETLSKSLEELHGTAGHMLKIWLVLKHMGLEPGSNPVEITTSNSTNALTQLFAFGDDEKRFLVPFSHTPRYYTMKSDASRSIVQSTIRRWCTSGSVVTCDPSNFLKISDGAQLAVECARRYPLGLGYGEDGFAIEDGQRVALPRTAFAVWYGRKTAIPDDEDPRRYLVQQMERELHLSADEIGLIFVDDGMKVGVSSQPLSDQDIFQICSPFIAGEYNNTVEILSEDYSDYVRRVRTMTPQLDTVPWLRSNPDAELDALLETPGGAILLYGPPRTGKTRAIDERVSRSDPRRATIQIHDGWTYDNLVEGLMPDDSGDWSWKSGPLKEAIETGKEFVVLEEVNRTALSQALGEVFSLIETAYRGEENALTLRSGHRFWIPSTTTFFFTMNTVDKSTEEVDDALLGRVAAIDFPPDSGALLEMLDSNGVPQDVSASLATVFTAIQDVYPLGHGYFAPLQGSVTGTEVALLYKTRIRPVIANFLGELRAGELTPVENLMGELFGLS